MMNIIEKDERDEGKRKFGIQLPNFWCISKVKKRN